MATVADRILDHLSEVPGGLDDGQLAQALGARRQTVNQACRRLAEQGRLHRSQGANGVIVNRLFNVQVSANGADAKAPPEAESVEAPEATATPGPAAAAGPTGAVDVGEPSAAVPEPLVVPDHEERAGPVLAEPVSPAAASAAADPEPDPDAADPDTDADPVVAEPAADADPVVGVPAAADVVEREVPDEAGTPDVPSVPQARSAADDQVAADLAGEQTRIPSARSGEPEEPTAPIPTARTSEADDAPAASVVPAVEVPVHDSAPPSEPARSRPASSDAAVSEDEAEADGTSASDSDVPSKPASAAGAPSSSEAERQVGRPWWRRLLPWGGG